MHDILIKNEAGTIPVATGRTTDPMNSANLRVTNLNPAILIVLGYDYVVGLDDNTGMTGRTCTALAGTTATFSL